MHKITAGLLALILSLACLTGCTAKSETHKQILALAQQADDICVERIAFKNTWADTGPTEAQKAEDEEYFKAILAKADEMDALFETLSAEEQSALAQELRKTPVRIWLYLRQYHSATGRNVGEQSLFYTLAMRVFDEPELGREELYYSDPNYAFYGEWYASPRNNVKGKHFTLVIEPHPTRVGYFLFTWYIYETNQTMADAEPKGLLPAEEIDWQLDGTYARWGTVRIEDLSYSVSMDFSTLTESYYGELQNTYTKVIK